MKIIDILEELDVTACLRESLSESDAETRIGMVQNHPNLVEIIPAISFMRSLKILTVARLDALLIHSNLHGLVTVLEACCSEKITNKLSVEFLNEYFELLFTDPRMMPKGLQYGSNDLRYLDNDDNTYRLVSITPDLLNTVLTLYLEVKGYQFLDNVMALHDVDLSRYFLEELLNHPKRESVIQILSTCQEISFPPLLKHVHALFKYSKIEDLLRDIRLVSSNNARKNAIQKHLDPIVQHKLQRFFNDTPDKSALEVHEEESALQQI